MSTKPRTQDLGSRVELVSMDPHCRDITVALYRQEREGQPAYLVHSYSRVVGAAERIDFLRAALAALAGLRRNGEWLFLPCSDAHQVAVRRAFLEACKLPSTVEPAARPLSVFEKKSGLTIRTESFGNGVYRVAADGAEEGKAARVQSVLSGLQKLGETSQLASGDARLAFPCAHPHDALVGVLLPRALNVRMTLREEEAAAARGLLVAPSQQK